MSDGPSKVVFISDFDHTLASEAVSGKNTAGSWSIFTSQLGEDYVNARQRLHDFYFPIERDNMLSPEYRSEKMSAWWKEHLDLLVQYGANKTMLEKALRNGKLSLRGKADQLFRSASRNRIPFLIFSAGLGDAYDVILETDTDMSTINELVYGLIS